MEENVVITGRPIKTGVAGSAPEIAVLNSRSWEDFATLINGAWHKGSEAFMEVGRILLEAKEELSKDEFNSLLKLRLDLDASVGRKLMCCASNSTLCAHVHKLPPCWSSIYELSKVPDDTLKAAIADGRISPKMLRKDAVALRKPKDDRIEESSDANPTELSDRPNELLEYWQMAIAAEQLAVLKHEGVDGILELLKEEKELLSKLYDRVIGLQVALASPVAASTSSTKLLTNLTGTLHYALGQKDPASGAQALTIIKAKLAANKRDPKDVCLAFVKRSKR
jgi:hypothetical protein